jgi:hypothetical protein
MVQKSTGVGSDIHDEVEISVEGPINGG